MPSKSPDKFDVLDAPPSRFANHPRGCGVGKLEHPQREKIVAAVNNPKWSAGALADALDKLGVPLSRTVIQTHRAAKCKCREAGLDK
jgi:hypothetical protein